MPSKMDPRDCLVQARFFERLPGEAGLPLFVVGHRGIRRAEWVKRMMPLLSIVAGRSGASLMARNGIPIKEVVLDRPIQRVLTGSSLPHESPPVVSMDYTINHPKNVSPVFDGEGLKFLRMVGLLLLSAENSPEFPNRWKDYVPGRGDTTTFTMGDLANHISSMRPWDRGTSPHMSSGSYFDATVGIIPDF